MITTAALATQLAEKYDIDQTAAHTAVETYAGQINDDTNLFDYERGELTDAGAEIVRDQFANDYLETTQGVAGSIAATHAQLRDAIKTSVSAARELEQQRDDEIARRDDLIRAAIKKGVRVEDIATDIGLGRARIYQIRDGRR